MANIGHKLIKMCTFTETEANGVITETLAAGFSLAKPVKTGLNINFSETPLYAGDTLAENAKEFVDGTVTHELSDLSDDEYAKTTGASISTGGEVTDSGEDVRPFIREGWISTRMKNNVKSYRVVVLRKVQFTPEAEEYETKGKSTAFKTPSIKGTVMLDKDGNWRNKQTFDTEAAAIAYLDSKVNIPAT